MRPKKSLLWGIMLVLCLSLPARAVGADSPPKQPSEPAAPQSESLDYNAYARFLAGLPTPQGKWQSYEKMPEWTGYAEAMNRCWQRCEAQRLKPMREWASKELDAARTDMVFYPFSGPDFASLYTLFPHARTYIMVGLEPVMALPDPSEISGDFLTSLQRSLSDYLWIGFFSTSRMASRIANSELRGVLPVLLFFLAREQAQVVDVRLLVMRPDGTIEEKSAISGGDSGRSIQGLRLVFLGPGSVEKQTLYYFRFNLQNGSLERHPQFVSFLESFGPLTTMTKAASYLLFSRYSSDIRQFILDRSRYVVQDDSGVPLEYFDREAWNLRFYGTYTGPLDLFPNRFQPDLAEAYEQGKDVYPLPFGFGYHFHRGASNLLFAAKKAEGQD